MAAAAIFALISTSRRLTAVMAAAATTALIKSWTATASVFLFSIATCYWLTAVMVAAATAASIKSWTATASIFLFSIATCCWLTAVMAAAATTVDQKLDSDSVHVVGYSVDSFSCLLCEIRPGPIRYPCVQQGRDNDNTYSVAQRTLWVYTA
jgi:hypothetical protein